MSLRRSHWLTWSLSCGRNECSNGRTSREQQSLIILARSSVSTPLTHIAVINILWTPRKRYHGRPYTFVIFSISYTHLTSFALRSFSVSLLLLVTTLLMHRNADSITNKLHIICIITVIILNSFHKLIPDGGEIDQCFDVIQCASVSELREQLMRQRWSAAQRQKDVGTEMRFHVDHQGFTLKSTGHQACYSALEWPMSYIDLTKVI